MIEGLYIIGAYLLGSISSAIILCRLMGLPDPRSGGSRNPGATNVMRLGGKKAAALTLMGDMLKGVIAVLVVRYLTQDTLITGLAGLSVFLGHLYPVFFGFRGGKGVATMLGALLGFHWAVGAATAVTWLGMARLFRISSLSALVATLLAPLYVYLIIGADLNLIIITAVMTLILFWRHRSNIQRLLSGEERPVAKSTEQSDPEKH